MVREETVFKTPLQLTVLHVRHCSGLPLGDVAVEGTGPVKRWKKEGVREETVFKTPKQLTASHVRHCSGLPLGDVAVESNDERKHW